jgi:hypothetical protein
LHTPPFRLAEPLEHRRGIDDIGDQDARDVCFTGHEPAEAVDTRDLDGLERLVADHPRIVAGRDVKHVVGGDIHLVAIVHEHVEPAAERDAEVAEGAPPRSHRRLEVDRPSPAGLDRRATDGLLAHLNASLENLLGAEDVVRRADALQLWVSHGPPSRQFACRWQHET